MGRPANRADIRPIVEATQPDDPRDSAALVKLDRELRILAGEHVFDNVPVGDQEAMAAAEADIVTACARLIGRTVARLPEADAKAIVDDVTDEVLQVREGVRLSLFLQSLGIDHKGVQDNKAA